MIFHEYHNPLTKAVLSTYFRGQKYHTNFKDKKLQYSYHIKLMNYFDYLSSNHKNNLLEYHRHYIQISLTLGADGESVSVTCNIPAFYDGTTLLHNVMAKFPYIPDW